jgi:hypothetical protein
MNSVTYLLNGLQVARSQATKMKNAAQIEAAKANWGKVTGRAALDGGGGGGGNISSGSTRGGGGGGGVETKDAPGSYFELDNGRVTVYGEAFGVLDKAYRADTAGLITSLVFNYVHFDKLVPYFGKFRTRFPVRCPFRYHGFCHQP